MRTPKGAGGAPKRGRVTQALAAGGRLCRPALVAAARTPRLEVAAGWPGVCRTGVQGGTAPAPAPAPAPGHAAPRVPVR